MPEYGLRVRDLPDTFDREKQGQVQGILDVLVDDVVVLTATFWASNATAIDLMRHSLVLNSNPVDFERVRVFWTKTPEERAAHLRKYGSVIKGPIDA